MKDSIKSFEDFSKADTMIRNPSIPMILALYFTTNLPDIVFKGLKTLKDLIALRFTEPSYRTNCNKPKNKVNLPKRWFMFKRKIV